MQKYNTGSGFIVGERVLATAGPPDEADGKHLPLFARLFPLKQFTEKSHGADGQLLQRLFYSGQGRD